MQLDERNPNLVSDLNYVNVRVCNLQKRAGGEGQLQPSQTLHYINPATSLAVGVHGLGFSMKKHA